MIVCGTCIIVLGMVACIDDKYSFFGLGLGVPAGLVTVLASGCCIYRSRGFGGYNPSSCKDSCFRFLGANYQIACPLVILWCMASTLHVWVLIKALAVILRRNKNTDTMFILAVIESILSVLTLSAVIWTVRIDIYYDPDRPEAMGGEISGSRTGMSLVPVASSSSERGVPEKQETC
uniref:Uncharacterized protein n=1 Tax=Clastoptera arizonana TaxID=38151 RepID=A0A1B6CZW5_9HEMI